MPPRRRIERRLAEVAEDDAAVPAMDLRESVRVAPAQAGCDVGVTAHEYVRRRARG